MDLCSSEFGAKKIPISLSNSFANGGNRRVPFVHAFQIALTLEIESARSSVGFGKICAWSSSDWVVFWFTRILLLFPHASGKSTEMQHFLEVKAKYIGSARSTRVHYVYPAGINLGSEWLISKLWFLVNFPPAQFWDDSRPHSLEHETPLFEMNPRERSTEGEEGQIRKWDKVRE